LNKIIFLLLLICFTIRFNSAQEAADIYGEQISFENQTLRQLYNQLEQTSPISGDPDTVITSSGDALLTCDI